jgi:hypothetical protein
MEFGARRALWDTMLPQSTPPTFILHDIFNTTNIYHLLKTKHFHQVNKNTIQQNVIAITPNKPKNLS